MTRPDYLRCVMTPATIRGIRERQEVYDKDPETYEREEKRREEEKIQEQEAEREFYQRDNGYAE